MEKTVLFDTHAHLNSKAFDSDRQAVLAGLPEKGIRLVMNPGCSLSSSRESVALANRWDYIYAAVGCHPDAACEVNEESLEELRKLCRENRKVLAIGEIGLDYHYENFSREVQKRAFSAQMELARELHLPVIVHDRDAHGDAMEIVRAFPEVTGVFHCYSGSVEMAQELIRMGWYVGFTGVLTFRNARRAVEVAAALPRDRVVLETDCPYMAPEPYRGRRNDPGYLPRMAQRLGEIWGVSEAEAGAITRENGKRLYRLAQ